MALQQLLCHRHPVALGLIGCVRGTSLGWAPGGLQCEVTPFCNWSKLPFFFAPKPKVCSSCKIVILHIREVPQTPSKASTTHQMSTKAPDCLQCCDAVSTPIIGLLPLKGNSPVLALNGGLRSTCPIGQANVLLGIKGKNISLPQGDLQPSPN